MNTNDFELLEIKDTKGHPIDQWIQSKFVETIDEVEKQFSQYRFDLAATAMYEFVWNDFCDWYIELSKALINEPGIKQSQKDYTKNNLIKMLDAILRMLHPTIPFITEEIWQSLSEENNNKSIMKADFPSSKNWKADTEIAANTEWLKNFVSSVRKIRSEMTISPKQSIKIIVDDASNSDIKRLKLFESFISCWDEKWKTLVVRPETLINQYYDEEWLPLLQTPPFPEYTSGHSVISRAAALTLTDLFGENFDFVDTTEVSYGLPSRSYKSFINASEEAAISRLYGGIHYMMAITEGVAQCQNVGDCIVKNIQTKKMSLAVKTDF